MSESPKRRLFHLAEELHSAMADELQEMMLTEILEDGYEVAMELIENDGKPFSKDVVVFASKLRMMGEILFFLDEFTPVQQTEEEKKQEDAIIASLIKKGFIHKPMPSHLRVVSENDKEGVDTDD